MNKGLLFLAILLFSGSMVNISAMNVNPNANELQTQIEKNIKTLNELTKNLENRFLKPKDIKEEIISVLRRLYSDLFALQKQVAQSKKASTNSLFISFPIAINSCFVILRTIVDFIEHHPYLSQEDLFCACKISLDNLALVQHFL